MTTKSKTLRLRDFMPYRLSVAANAVSRVIATTYEDQFGLSRHEWRLIAVLHEHKIATQQDLVALTQMDKIAVSRAARALSKKGLMIRTPCTEDGRAWKLKLSAKGLATHKAIAPTAKALERRILSTLSKTEGELLNDILMKLSASAAQLIKDDILINQVRSSTRARRKSK